MSPSTPRSTTYRTATISAKIRKYDVIVHGRTAFIVARASTSWYRLMRSGLDALALALGLGLGLGGGGGAAALTTR